MDCSFYNNRIILIIITIRNYNSEPTCAILGRGRRNKNPAGKISQTDTRPYGDNTDNSEPAAATAVTLENDKNSFADKTQCKDPDRHSTAI